MAAASWIATPAAAQAARDTARMVGDRDAFAARIVAVAFQPTRVTYARSCAAYITLISVSDSSIHAIVPANGVRQRIESAGVHVASTSRQTDALPQADDGITAHDVRAYSRCLSNAREAESYCRPPAPRRAVEPVAPRRVTPGRYLMVFASDTPIEYRDIVDLVVSEGDPRSIAEVIGRKLFGIRGARWSGSFLPC